MNRSGRLSDFTARLILLPFFASLTLAGGMATSVAAASDPTRPTNNRDATPPGGGGGGGGVPDHQIALGVAMPNERDMNALDTLTSQLGGNRPAMWAVWSHWGNPGSKEFPTETAVALRDRGVLPIIWWEPVRSDDLSDPTYARHQNITSGLHDEYILRFARDAKDFGGTVILRFAQEANANHFPWGVGRFDNTNATFIAAWRHIHGLFESVGADNVRFLWSMARQPCQGGCNPYTALYPGHPYVDILGFSGYNWGNVDGKTWTSMYDLYRRASEQMREVSSDKPIMVAETGSGAIGGDKAAWIRDGYRRVFDELPEIGSIVYLHADLRDQGHRDWRLTTPPEAFDAYAEIVGMWRFGGRSPFTAQRQIARVEARLERERAERQAERKAARLEARKQATESDADRGPRVDHGSAEADDQGGGGQSSAGAANRQSKRRKSNDEPPAVPDTFNR